MIEPEVLQLVREQIRKSEVIMKELEEDISEAHRAGIDVTDLRNKKNELSLMLKRLKSVYGG